LPGGCRRVADAGGRAPAPARRTPRGVTEGAPLRAGTSAPSRSPPGTPLGRPTAVTMRSQAFGGKRARGRHESSGDGAPLFCFAGFRRRRTTARPRRPPRLERGRHPRGERVPTSMPPTSHATTSVSGSTPTTEDDNDDENGP
jgi:hypothetical protein